MAIKVTVFETGEHCNELGRIKVSHISMFDKNGSISFNVYGEDQIRLIEIFIKAYVKFSCQGSVITYPPQFQRVRLRFDSIDK